MPSCSFFLVCFIILGFLSPLNRAIPILDESFRLSHSNSLDERCQSPKTAWGNPLEGCPKGTVFVSKNHPAARFRTINSALKDLIDDGSSRTVLIDEGIYYEKVVVGRSSPTIFAGVTPNVRDPESNRVQVWQSSYVNQSDILSTKRNCDAVVLGVGTGTQVGSSDFKAYNINFNQRQFFEGQEVTQYQLGPSAALCVERSNASFYGCGFASYQDTIFVGPNSQAFFFKSIVKGMTDQLYGMGKAWFERVQLLSRACGGGIAAWQGDPEDPSVGVYISNSNIERSPDASTLRDMEGRCHLGRPWNVYSHAVYLNTRMSSIISNAGFKIWSKKQANFDPAFTRFAEYKSSGDGGNMALRDYQLEKSLSDHEAEQITYRHIFGGQTHWIDSNPILSW